MSACQVCGLIVDLVAGQVPEHVPGANPSADLCPGSLHPSEPAYAKVEELLAEAQKQVAQLDLRLTQLRGLSVQAECSSCGGTGVYCGFAEPKGTGVVCLDCDGSGCKKIGYFPFTARKRRSGVNTVCRGRGSLVATGVGPANAGIPYEDFLKGKKPT
jgi:hypothetical protein